MRALTKSFYYAFSGFWYAIMTQRNLRIHLTAAVLVIWLSLLLDVDGVQISVLILTVGAVIAAELFNTAVEATVDLCVQQYHPKAKIAKDTAAAAVLVTALAAVGVGCSVFLSAANLAVLREVIVQSPLELIPGGVIAAAGLVFIILPAALQKHTTVQRGPSDE